MGRVKWVCTHGGNLAWGDGASQGMEVKGRLTWGVKT